MKQQINLRKLWLITSTVWVISVIFIFYRDVSDNYEKVALDYSFEKTQSLWDSCASTHSPNDWYTIRYECKSSSYNAIEVCSNLGGYKGWLNCAEAKNRTCLRSSLPVCATVLDQQNSKVGAGAFKKFIEIGASNSFWLAALLILLGPLTFWLGPKIIRLAKRWLYK